MSIILVKSIDGHGDTEIDPGAFGETTIRRTIEREIPVNVVFMGLEAGQAVLLAEME